MPPVEESPAWQAPGGQLPANLLHFGRLLRQVGILVSTAQICDLARSLDWIDLERREDFYFAARCTLLNDARQIELFNRAFDLFWSGQVELLVELGQANQVSSITHLTESLPDSDRPARRDTGRQDLPTGEPDDDQRPDETSFLPGFSPREILFQKDFADFTEEELLSAQRLMKALTWKLEPRRTRRTTRAIHRTGHLDLRRVIRQNLSIHGELLRLSWREQKTKQRPLVLICDISGSMERYSRLLLTFLYILVQENRRIEAFVFATRLTCITPALRRRDPGAAIQQAAGMVVDWSGGTRIGQSLKTFNFQWSRRVLGRGAIVLIISDGWDRGETGLLHREMARLKASAFRLIWLNPLAGAPDYQPLVRGMQAVLPYLDDFLPLHNLSSLEQLTRKLGSL